MCLNPCNRCGQCDCGGACVQDNIGCLDITGTTCLVYDDTGLPCLGIIKGTDFNDLLDALDQKICILDDASGKVISNILDTCPGALIDKLQAGANIIISGVGSGCDSKIKIDAVLGGQIIDEKVKASSTDTISGYLMDKIIGGDCINIQKINIGFNEKIQINIDWNCVLTKLGALAGFCTLVNNCTGNTVMTCPSISLNSPLISGSNVTVSWISTGTQFNVYFDGILQPGMPTSSTTFNKTGLADGSHFIQVVANCLGGTPNSASTNFIINTTCPTASGLNVILSGGTASLSWIPGSGVNISSQDIQYRLQGSSSWTTSANVSSSANTGTIPGLALNEIYEFQIVTNCTVGGPTPSSTLTTAELTCPTLTLTPTNTSIQYQFASVGGDVSQYVIELYNNTGSVLLQTNNENSPFASTITNTFSGLTNATNYQVKVTVKAGTFTKVCNPQAISTTAPPVCPPGTGLDVSLS